MPKFEHDCEKCRFIGSTHEQGSDFDVYFCNECDGGTWIARYGSERSQYYSVSKLDADLSTLESVLLRFEPSIPIQAIRRAVAQFVMHQLELMGGPDTRIGADEVAHENTV